MPNAPDFSALFQASPYPYLLISPDFTLIGANAAYLKATDTTAEAILCKHIFKAFPANPRDPESTNLAEVLRSIEIATATRAPHTAMGSTAGPALASILSVRIAPEAQGSLQGVLASINGVAAILTPVAMTWLFSAFSNGLLGIHLPGAPYLLSALLAAVGISLVRVAQRNSSKPVPAQGDV